MTKRNKLIMSLRPYFNIRELVCPHVWNKFKENAWQFLSTELLSTLLTLRTVVIGEPIAVNICFHFARMPVQQHHKRQMENHRMNFKALNLT